MYLLTYADHNYVSSVTNCCLTLIQHWNISRINTTTDTAHSNITTHGFSGPCQVSVLILLNNIQSKIIVANSSECTHSRGLNNIAASDLQNLMTQKIRTFFVKSYWRSTEEVVLISHHMMNITTEVCLESLVRDCLLIWWCLESSLVLLPPPCSLYCWWWWRWA